MQPFHSVQSLGSASSAVSVATALLIRKKRIQVKVAFLVYEIAFSVSPVPLFATLAMLSITGRPKNSEPVKATKSETFAATGYHKIGIDTLNARQLMDIAAPKRHIARSASVSAWLSSGTPSARRSKKSTRLTQKKSRMASL